MVTSTNPFEVKCADGLKNFYKKLGVTYGENKLSSLFEISSSSHF